MLIVEENGIIGLDILLGLRKTEHNVVFVRNANNIVDEMEDPKPKIIITSLNVLEKQFIQNGICLSDDVSDLISEVRGLNGAYTFVYNQNILEKFSKPYLINDLVSFISNSFMRETISRE